MHDFTLVSVNKKPLCRKGAKATDSTVEQEQLQAWEPGASEPAEQPAPEQGRAEQVTKKTGHEQV